MYKNNVLYKYEKSMNEVWKMCETEKNGTGLPALLLRLIPKTFKPRSKGSKKLVC